MPIIEKNDFPLYLFVCLFFKPLTQGLEVANNGDYFNKLDLVRTFHDFTVNYIHWEISVVPYTFASNGVFLFLFSFFLKIWCGELPKV